MVSASRLGLFATVFFAAALTLSACSGSDGTPGAQGPPGNDTGTLSGTVTNKASGAPLADAGVSVDPAIEGVVIATAEDGTFSVDLPIGAYVLTVEKTNFTTSTVTATIAAGVVTTKNVALDPTAAVLLTVAVDGEVVPGNTLQASVTVTPLDGSTVQSILWKQDAGVDLTLGSPGEAATSVVLPPLPAFKDELFKVIEEPPISEAQLPADLNIELPEASPGLLDRFVVQALNPFELEETGLIGLSVKVTTSSGSYTKSAQLHAELPWVSNPGLRNVPVDVPVLLHGKDVAEGHAYDWVLAPPSGSGAMLTDATSQNPYFTPDVPGNYTVTVTNASTSPAEMVTLELYAGDWEGAITRQDANGRPTSACTLCHDGSIAPDKFTPWAKSGHAEIFTDNFNTGTHYSTACLTCHSVGWNAGAANGGIDDAPGYGAFLQQFTSDGTNFVAKPDNWTNLLAQHPDVAKLANVQCENCHGPNSTQLHFNQSLDPERISISADVCGVCHGEPLRHARFQQWQLSPHSNYELALAEGTIASCATCHSGQGFIQWAKQGFTGRVEAPSADEVHPQTCAVCHEPHNPGNLSGEPNNATVRLIGDTPMLLAGFSAHNVGRGAVCMPCHNTRRGLMNDEAVATATDRAPHSGAQTDLLMGQNAFFVQVGVRGKHSLITDTCTNCHMEQTNPPDLLSYSLGGTNHTFRPSITICQNCHASIDGKELQASVSAEMEVLRSALEESVSRQINAHLAAGNMVSVTGLVDENDAELPDVDIMPGELVDASGFASSHGRQAVDLSVNEMPIGHASLDAITVLGGHSLSSVSEESQILVKAGWNLLLVQDDKSFGVHNPSFAFQIISAALSKLDNTDFTKLTIRSILPELTGDQEVPPVETEGSGNAVITLNASQTVLSFRLELAGLNSAQITQAHIHVGDSGVNGPIIFWLCTDLGNAPPDIPPPPSCSSLPGALTGNLTAADLNAQPDAGVTSFYEAISALLFGDTYINVHTTANPGGEVRGRISL